jgi:hypothetical protein
VSKKSQQGSYKVYIDQMKYWQKLLVKTFAKKKMTISKDELEVAAKSTLARIIFLHICEKDSVIEKGTLQEVLYPRRNEIDEIYEYEYLSVQRDRLRWESLNRTVQQRLFMLFDYTYRWNSPQFSSFLKSYKIKIPETEFDKAIPKLKLDDGVLRKIIEEVIQP